MKIWPYNEHISKIPSNDYWHERTDFFVILTFMTPVTFCFTFLRFHGSKRKKKHLIKISFDKNQIFHTHQPLEGIFEFWSWQWPYFQSWLFFGNFDHLFPTHYLELFSKSSLPQMIKVGLIASDNFFAKNIFGEDFLHKLSASGVVGLIKKMTISIFIGNWKVQLI